MARVSQLRIYTIEDGKLDEFVQRWKAGVLPLRLGHGFTVDGAWVAREENRFVWILSYDGPETWEAANAAYYDSDERKALGPDPAKLIAEVQTWFISDVVRQ